MLDSNQPTLSIRLMTYNHEPFIRRAMESILSQKVDFSVELVVGDDFSTDNTLEIISEYQSTDTIMIKILNRPVGGEYWTKRKKFGRLYNFQNILENCHGKYIALIDGDDYWTDPEKLQIQVDFLEKNPSYSICCHKTQLIYDSLNKKEDYIELDSKPDTLNLRHLAKHNLLHTSSIVYKSNGIPKRLFRKVNFGDYAIHLYNAQFGNIKYLPNNMSVYRIHENGVWSELTRKTKNRQFMKNMMIFAKYFAIRNPAVAIIFTIRTLKLLLKP